MTPNEHAAALPEFIEEQKDITLEDKQSEFDAIFRIIRRYKTIDPSTKLFEIGTGIGWLVILCEKLEMTCKGIEVSPELVQCAHQLGRKYGITPDIRLGSIEETDIGSSEYDIVIATSSFEHIKDWKAGLRKAFDTLKPGGVLYFYSTNRFSFKQGEFDFLLYSWLPDRWRYRLRRAMQGDGIMQWGIDFNQFTYFQLRRFFKQLGFSQVLDRVDILDPENLNHPTPQKKMVLRILEKFKLLKHLFLFFSDGTLFICIK